MPPDESDPFVIDEAVHNARKNEVWRREYMTLVQRDLENQIRGEERGRMDATRLINYLWRSGRGEEAERAETDHDYLNQLLEEFKDKT